MSLFIVTLAFQSRTLPESTLAWQRSTSVISSLVEELLPSLGLAPRFSQEKSPFSYGRNLALSACLLVMETGTDPDEMVGDWPGHVSSLDCWLEENWSWEHWSARPLIS